ncbi:DEAD/DEAH box helicase [Sulfurihydrogenibium subterraneum]|uniref:DEAD/DEAH box helicase n=1 Tax=Sulfurihydrogenibium subterraneum TaxID=171121 RepID=UPI00048FA73B|nr:DEAD/DEAH box helicase [Sulfurihydrogenibium subterraneum]
MEIVYKKVLEPNKAVYSDYEFECKKINDFLKKNSIKLYSHQVEGIKAVLEGKDVVITTPTASGKSMIYTLSILNQVCKNPSTKALLIFPLVALARDQENKIRSLIEKSGVRASVATYYGSTERDERYKIKNNPPNILITTPDMLSKGILPFHYTWEKLFENLKFVVIDELHSYRGVLGSHVSNVIKRLNRIVKHYTGELPIYVCNSATIRNPVGFAKKFVNKDFVEIDKSGAPTPKKVIYISKPTSNEKLMSLLKEHLHKEIPTIVFIDSRKDVELLYKNIKIFLEKEGRIDLISKVSPYRSGYSSKERQEIENKMATGELKVLISTSALEMGIDIGSIDSVIVKGFPGTLASLWQRFGRSGRSGRESINYYIAKNDALDQYYVKNPTELFNRSVEEPVINPENKYILKKHILVAAKEIPLDIKDLTDKEKEVVRELLEEGKLTFRNGKFFVKSKSINTDFNIRSTGSSYDIIEINKNRKIGDINQEYAFYEMYKDAVYLHGGETYKVLDVDEEKKVIYVENQHLNYYTTPILNTEIDILKIEKERVYKDIKIYYGELNVKSSIVGYSKIEIEENKKIKDIEFEESLERNFITKGMWFTLEDYYENLVIERTKKEKESFVLDKLKKIVDETSYRLIVRLTKESKEPLKTLKEALSIEFLKSQKRVKKEDIQVIEDLENTLKGGREVFIGSLHGVEHGMIGIYSIFAMNDRWDIGGMSTNFHNQTEKASIFIYDGFEGGIGYAEVGFERVEEILKATYKNIKNCKCISGCPSCILSPKCGNANEYLDKIGSIVLLELITA